MIRPKLALPVESKNCVPDGAEPQPATLHPLPWQPASAPVCPGEFHGHYPRCQSKSAEYRGLLPTEPVRFFLALLCSSNYHVYRAQLSNFAAMGILLPDPKALEVTFSPGTACLRLYSFRSTVRITHFTVSGSKLSCRISCSERCSSR